MLSLHSPKLPETIFYISVAQKPSRWTEGNNHANITPFRIGRAPTGVSRKQMRDTLIWCYFQREGRSRIFCFNHHFRGSEPPDFIRLLTTNEFLQLKMQDD